MSSPRRPWPRSRPAAAGDELASYADPRLEVFVAPERDVVVLVALGVPVSLSRSEWDARMVSADDGNELAAGLMQDLSGDRATEIIEAAREAAAQDTDPFVPVRPPALEMPAPGEVDFDLLEDSDREPTECYDPEDNLEEARL